MMRLEARLSDACRKNNLDKVRELVEQGANITTYNLPLRVASSYGYLDIVKYLVSKGANIHLDNDFPIISASIHGYPDLVKYFIEQGANVHVNNDRPLEMANMFNYPKIVKLLLSLEPSIYWLTHSREDIREIYKEYKNEFY